MAEATPELSPNVEITKLPLIQLSAKLPVQGAIASLLENAFPALYPIAPPPESKEKEGAVALSEQLPPINNNVGETSSQVNVSGHEAEQPTLARQKSAKATTKGVAPSSRPGSKGGINSGAQKQEPIPSTIAPDVSTGHADVSAALADPAGQLSSQNGSTAEASVGAEQIGQSSSFKKRSGPNGEKVEKIELDCQVSVQHGAELISYLERQLIQSKEADMAQLLDDDAVFTPNHRKTGLPMKQSQLMIDRGRLAEEGLLDPKEILEREKEMEEQAQMPPRTLEYLDVNAKGYLKTTANLAVRQKITLGRAATLGASLTKRSREVKAATSAGAKTGTLGGREPSTDPTLRSAKLSDTHPGQLGRTRVEKELERNILEGLTGKMQYLPNPRYRMDTLTLKPVPSKANATSLPGTELVVAPSSVQFSDYDAGKIYEQTLEIHNVSSISRRVRVLPPSSGLFAVSLPHFPTPAGLIAPGMHCTVTISFAPKTLSDVTDYVTVQSDLTSFHVALFARRDPPVLSLPAVLDCGACLVDHTSVLKFPFRNSGGPGAFRLSFLPEGTETADGVQQWRRAEEREAGRNENGTEADGGTGNGDAETACGDTSARLKNEIASMSNTRSVLGVNGPEDGQNVLEGDPTSVQWGPFTLSPASFRLGQSESGTITVTFNPHSEDRFSETLQLSCDNCRSQTLEVVGRGAILDVQVAEIDGRGVGEGELQQGVWFEATPPGAPLHRTVTVENRTALDVPVRCELAPVLNELGEMRLTYADVSAITGAGLSQAAESILGERVVGRRRSGDSPGETAAERNAPVFTVEPAEIVIGADSRAEFVLTFAPDRVDLLQSTARFEVDTRRVNYPGGANFGVTLSSFGEGQGQDSISSSFPSALRSPLSRSGTEGRSGRLERLASKKDRTAASYADVSADNGGGPVTSSELVLGGVGAFIAVALTPEVVAFPGEILIGQAYRQMVTLSNRSAAAARFSWAESGRPNAESGHGEGGILAERGPGFGEFGINARSSTVASGGAFFRPSLSFSPQEGTVPPFEDLSVEVEVTARQLGPFDAGFECRVDNFYGGPLRLRARGRAVAPAVRFDQAAADFGLVERGHVAQVEVVVRNDSDVPASWAVEQVAEAEMEAGISSQEQLTRQQSIRQLEVSAAGRTEPETEPTAVLGTETKATPAASGAGSEFEEESTAAERADTGSLEPTADTSVSGGTKPETSGRAEGSWGPSSSFCRSLGLERTTSSRSTFGDTFSPHVLEISPSSGFLGAHSSARLLVSFSPAHCQPLQTVLELHTGPVVEEDPSSGSGVLLLSGSGTEVKHILATATVVAPRVVLDQSELDLGTCFVNMPLERNLVLLNLSAIPADFAWAPESIGDPSESLEVSVAPKSGRIPAKGRQEVLVRISPVREPAGGADCGLPSGKLGSSVEKILTCDVLGADIPLALRISAKVQGLRFSFEVLGGATLRPGPHRTRSPLTDTGVATERDTELRESEGTGRQTEDGGTSQREEARLSGAESPDGSNGTDAQQIPPAVTESSGADSAAEPSGTAEGDSLDPLSETESTDQPALETGHPSAESKEELSVAEDRPGTSQLEPLASVPARLDFGFGLSIGERKTLTLVVKNHSGVRAPVSVRLLHMGSAISSGTLLFSGLLSPGSKSVHSAGGMTSGKSSLGSGFWPLDVSKSRSTVSGDLGQSTGKRKGQKALLGTAHETARNFNSSLGQTVLTKRQETKSEEQVLDGDRPAVLTITPSPEGSLEPWSTWQCDVTCFSSVCGHFTDILTCQVGDFPPTEIPVTLAVSGTPLFLHRDRKLLEGYARTSREGRALRVAWADAPFAPSPEPQTFWVTNPSPARARVEWAFERPAGFAGLAPARVEMRVDGEGRVRVGLEERMEEVREGESCFQVTPKVQELAPRSSAPVTLTFLPPYPGTVEALLVGHHSLSELSPGVWSPFSRLPSTLDPLRVNLRASRSIPRLEPGRKQLHFTCFAGDPSGGKTFSRKVTFSNAQPFAVSVAVDATGPFVADDVQASVTSSQASVSSAHVPPRESVTITVGFRPPDSALQSAEDSAFQGSLLLTFSNGTEQVFPLSADFLRPEVLPSAGTLAFPSKVLVTSQRTLTFTLSNPTQADATWQLVDGGSDGGASSPSDIDEGVFAVEPLRGRIEGRGVGHPKTQTVTLRFVPTESRPYTRRLILKVDKGRGGVVTLTGEGTLDERFEG